MYGDYGDEVEENYYDHQQPNDDDRAGDAEYYQEDDQDQYGYEEEPLDNVNSNV